MAVRIREARPGEEQGLLALYDGLFEPPGSRPASWDPARAARALAGAIEGDRATVLVAEEGGEAVGLCTAYLDLDSVRFGLRCWVEDLVVETGSHSRGAGGALLDAAAEWAEPPVQQLGHRHDPVAQIERDEKHQQQEIGRQRPPFPIGDRHAAFVHGARRPHDLLAGNTRRHERRADQSPGHLA